jgi:TPR repeat protein
MPLSFSLARRLWPALALSLLSGCQNMPSASEAYAQASDFLDKTVTSLSQQFKKLSNVDAQQNDRIYDRELDELFGQPFIDPLTRYLEQHQNDASRARHLSMVLEERDDRCRVIAERFVGEPRTTASLQRYSKGYAYSCPQQVEQFAAEVALASKAAPAAARPTAPTQEIARPVTSPAVPDPARSTDSRSRQQLNNCHLLFTIKNYRQAQDACRPAAEAGDAQIQAKMAVIATALKDYPQALEWAQLSASKSAEGRYQLAELYYRGLGVSQDYPLALQHYRQAARQGLANAQYRSGQMLAKGQGAAQDLPAAKRYLQQAAEQGHRGAQAQLGQMYLDSDPNLARQWLTRAARQGSATAQFDLGRMAISAQQPAEAYVWFSLAQQSGSRQAGAELEQFDGMLSEAQIAQAQQQVRTTLEKR